MILKPLILENDFMSLRGKVVLITGASGGIAKALIFSLLSHGAKLSLATRAPTKLNWIKKQKAKFQKNILILPIDLTNERSILQAFKDSKKHWGKLDILINNAAFGTKAPIHNGVTKIWKEMLEINILATTIMMREALRYFDRKKGGQIINISSTSAHRIPPEGGFYAATKFALKALSEILRQELTEMKSPTRVSCVSPGRVATNFFQDPLAPPPKNKTFELLNPQDVAEAIIYQLNCPKHVAVQDIILRSYRQKT
jgi:17beta-estradiol 17-dehydrogenase / 3beta-hydroxysteroid 3-dehydrogenase